MVGYGLAALAKSWHQFDDCPHMVQRNNVSYTPITLSARTLEPIPHFVYLYAHLTLCETKG